MRVRADAFLGGGERSPPLIHAPSRRTKEAHVTTGAQLCQGELTLSGIVELALLVDGHAVKTTSLSRIVRAVAEVRRAEDALRSARDELRQAIVSAREEGESLAAIARTVGVTRQRIKQIIG